MDSTLETLAGSSFDAVLFDMDGTLIDSTAAIVRCWTRWAIEHAVGEEAFARAHGHGRPAADIVADLLPPELVAAGTQRITDLEVEDVEGVVRLPGTAELLAALPRERWAIVTSCTLPLARARAGAARLPEPGAWVTFDDVRRGKPDPEPYLLGARRLGVDPARCLVVEDAPAGLLSGRAAGCATLAVTTTHAPGELVADAIVASLADVAVEVARAGVRLVPPTGAGRPSAAV
ncbi:sugar-phosphatase [Kineococcus xinjiangensis]|uniref:Sugar-phosphatase n=1 Tax=Kineococcus xinjiangensis TaxID=512762 RepID=A0A2S6IVV7_9ACTN|nr:HAD-IA family hydrolase [Kineococcus xinjiangensis]PPK98484.1 sugar-phosphatase [Kineococcus xinjiangensis]